MDASKPKCAIQKLKEHLQHQQEPFSLQDYLLERSYMFKNCNLDSSNIHHLYYSAKNLKWSIKYDLHKKRKRILQATEFLKTLPYKFNPTVDNKEFSYYVHEITADTQATGPTNERFSLKRLAASSDHISNNHVGNNVLLYGQHHSSTLVDTFQSFTLPKLEISEVDTGSKPYWKRSKENEQQYRKGSKWKEPLPDAVCLLRSPEAPVIPVPILSQKLVRDPVFSTYLRKLLVNSNILKFGRATKDKMAGKASLCQRNRRILQKREQLPFGCVENKGKSVSMKAVLESEDLQCHFSLLEKQCTQVKKITHLLHTESSVTVTSQEWDDNREIHREIGDAIMDDMVREIIDLFILV